MNNSSYVDEDGHNVISYTGRNYNPATMAPENFHEAIIYHDWSREQDQEAFKRLTAQWSRSS